MFIGALVIAGPWALARRHHRRATPPLSVALPVPHGGELAGVRARAWLPPGYAMGKARYPVLYMLDRSANAPWYVIKAGGADPPPPVIIVAVTLATKTADVPDALGPWLATKLKPLVDRRFRTRPAAADTIIAGTGAEALVALDLIARQPNAFARALCLSTDWPIGGGDATAPVRVAASLEHWNRYLTERLGAPAGRRIWFDHGDRGADRSYGAYQSEIDRLLIRIGWQPQSDFETRSYVGAGPDARAWAARLPEALAWVLRDD